MSWNSEGSNFSVAYTGTGATQSFKVGFEPAFVKVIRLSDGNVFSWSASLASPSSVMQEGTPAFDVVSSSDLGVGNRAITLSSAADVNSNGVAYLLWASR